MREMTFFEEIIQQPIETEEHRFCNPTFYYDVTTVTTAFLTPLTKIKAKLPSPELKPIPITPWHSLTMISAFEYRDCDIGPYNEVLIGFPVTIGHSASVYFGARRELSEPLIYVWHLPVTTEIARYGGVEFFGFPKFIGEIEFERKNGWIDCRLTEHDEEILTLSSKQIKTQTGERMRMHPLTVKNDRILRCEVIAALPQIGVSGAQDHVRLELGGHPIADELRALSLGRMMEYRYAPAHQLTLTNVLESYPG